MRLRSMPTKTSVLVVDDDPLLLSLLSEALDSIGYEPVQATSAEEALLKLETEHVDIIVADINLPGIDGLALARKAKNMSPSLPVVLMTGVSMKDIENRAYRAGADAFLDKPFRIAAVEKVLQSLLGQPVGRMLRVMLIDDNDQYRETLTEYLGAKSFEVTAVRTGAEAIAAVAGQGFDVVMTDLVMPDIDGLEVARQIKQLSPSTHVMIYTGSSPDGDRRRDIQTTADAFLSKPLSLEKVAETLACIA